MNDVRGDVYMESVPFIVGEYSGELVSEGTQRPKEESKV